MATVFRFWTKWNSLWFKIEKKTVTTIISYSMWKEMEIEFFQCKYHHCHSHVAMCSNIGATINIWVLNPGRKKLDIMNKKNILWCVQIKGIKRNYILRGNQTEQNTCVFHVYYDAFACQFLATSIKLWVLNVAVSSRFC